MATNSLLTPTAVTRKIQQVLHGKLNLAKNVNRQYDSSFANSGGKIGDSLKIRLPNKYTVRTGKNLAAQGTSETSSTLTVATQVGVDMTFSSAELTMEMDNFAERIIEPAAAVVASNIENAIAARFVDIPNLVGTAGTTPATMLVVLQAGARLDDNLVPRENKRVVALSPLAMATVVDAYKGLFQRDSKIADQYDTGMIKDMATGFKWGMCPVINSQANSAGVVTSIAINNGTLTGDTITVDTTTTAYSAGTVITIDTVFAVNDETKVAYSHLKQFVVTSATATALTISPSIITTGATQNVSAAAADGDAIVVVGTASEVMPQHLAFHKDWLALATADLEDVSKFGAWGAREVYDGISIRIARQYDINSDNFPCRLDVLYGVKTIRPELCVRITG
jgi:hypothetical protein